MLFILWTWAVVLFLHSHHCVLTQHFFTNFMWPFIVPFQYQYFLKKREKNPFMLMIICDILCYWLSQSLKVKFKKKM